MFWESDAFSISRVFHSFPRGFFGKFGRRYADVQVEEEAGSIVEQTLLEIGVDLHASMADAPEGAPARENAGEARAAAREEGAAQPAAAEADAEAADLEARFAALTSS